MKPKYDIIKLLKNYKTSYDEKSLLKIIECMYPIINRYSRQAYWSEYDDMQQELMLSVIEAAQRIENYDNEGASIKFLANAVKNRFLELYRKHRNIKNQIGFASEMLENICNHDYESYADIEFKADLKSLTNCSSPLQQQVAYYILSENTTDTEIARNLNVSRQYVNRCKKTIFHALHSYCSPQ